MVVDNNKMDKLDKQIIVVPKDRLFGNEFFEGFKSHEEIDYEARILSNLKSMRRGDAEEDPSHKQPIGYGLIVNPKNKTVFAYQRSSKDEDYIEKKLQGKWSWGVGGHVEPLDGTENPIRKNILRELNEEVKINGNILGEPKVLGYIYHDHGVHQVHFGILYVLELEGDAIPKDPEIAQGKMVSLQELENICDSEDCDVEEWSRTALLPLRAYFNSVN